MAGCTYTDLNKKGKFTFQGTLVRKNCNSYVLGTLVDTDVDVEVYEFLYEGPPLAFNYNGIRQYITDGSVYSMAKDFFWRNTPHSKFQWPTYKTETS